MLFLFQKAWKGWKWHGRAPNERGSFNDFSVDVIFLNFWVGQIHLRCLVLRSTRHRFIARRGVGPSMRTGHFLGRKAAQNIRGMLLRTRNYELIYLIFAHFLMHFVHSELKSHRKKMNDSHLFFSDTTKLHSSIKDSRQWHASHRSPFPLVVGRIGSTFPGTLVPWGAMRCQSCQQQFDSFAFILAARKLGSRWCLYKSCANRFLWIDGQDTQCCVFRPGCICVNMYQLIQLEFSKRCDIADGLWAAWMMKEALVTCPSVQSEISPLAEFQRNSE